jgi:hypothetical protein
MEPSPQHETLQPKPAGDTLKADGPDPYAGFDRDVSRRPGYGSVHGMKAWPNARSPVTRQPRDIPVFMHGRSNKTFPPVFGTDCPPKGLSGQLRALAYGYPDHVARHWLMLLFADRVDSWEHRLKKAWPLVVPAVVGGVVLRALRRR